MSNRKIVIIIVFLLAIIAIFGGSLLILQKSKNHLEQQTPLYDPAEVEKTQDFIENLDTELERVRNTVNKSSVNYEAAMANIQQEMRSFNTQIQSLADDWNDGVLDKKENIAVYEHFQRLQADPEFQQELAQANDLRVLDNVVKLRIDMERTALDQNKQILVDSYALLSANIGTLVAEIATGIPNQDPALQLTIEEIQTQQQGLDRLIQLAGISVQPNPGDSSVFDQIKAVITKLTDLLGTIEQHPGVQALLSEMPSLKKLTESVGALLHNIRLLVLTAESIVSDIAKLVNFWYELEELMLSIFFTARDCAGAVLPFLILPSKTTRVPDPLIPKPHLCAGEAAWFADWTIGGPGNCFTSGIVGGRCYSLGGFVTGLNVLLQQAGPNNLFNKFITVIDVGSKSLQDGTAILTVDLPAVATELPKFSQEMAGRIAIESFRLTIADFACQYIKPEDLNSFFEGYDSSNCNDVIANASKFFNDLGGLVHVNELFEFDENNKWVYWENRIKPVVNSFDRIIKDIQLAFGITIPWADQIRPVFNQGSQWVDAFATTLALRQEIKIEIEQIEPGIYMFEIGYGMPESRGPPSWLISQAQAIEARVPICIIRDASKNVILDTNACKIGEPIDLSGYPDTKGWEVCIGEFIDASQPINATCQPLDGSSPGDGTEPPPPPPPGNNGQCTVDADCNSDSLVCKPSATNGLNACVPKQPNGFDGECTTDPECGQGLVCRALPNGFMACVQEPDDGGGDDDGGIDTTDCPPGFTCFDPPSKFDNLIVLVNAIIDWLINIGVVIAAAMVIYSGLLYMTAMGNTTKVAAASKVLAYVAVGVAILFLAKGATMIVENALGIQ